MRLSADWAGMLALSNSFVHCFVLCVWVRGSRSCICSRLLLPSLFRLVCCLCASRVVFFSWCCGAPFFCCCCSVFVVGCRLFLVLPVCLGCVRFGSLSPGFPPPSPPPLVSPLCLLVQSVLCWSLPPGIWLYLQRSGCHTFDMACCG